MDRAVVNRRVLDLLSRFQAVDRTALMADVARVSEESILEDSGLIGRDGQVNLSRVGVMEALLTKAVGGEPKLTLPRNTRHIREALILFLKLNQTAAFGLRSGDTARDWSARVLDRLFFMMSDQRSLSMRDQIVLLRVSEDPDWQAAFAYALGLYLEAAQHDRSFIRRADAPALQAARRSFKQALDVRQAKLPKSKYGNAHAGMNELAEYAVGQYLRGADVNEALQQMLVQAQLGTGSQEGQAVFDRFLEANNITAEMFPTTAQELTQLVVQELQFQETEEEVVNALYLYSVKTGQEDQMRNMIGSFADVAFPVAAKCSRIMSFAGLEPSESGLLMARWMQESGALERVRSSPLRSHVEGLLPVMSRDDVRNLNAFRTGRTRDTVGRDDLETYVNVKLQLLTLNAINQKMHRVERALKRQTDRTEQFCTAPGREILKDMRYGMEEFFRSMRTVFEDIVAITENSRRTHVQRLTEFNKTYGPLSLVSALVPREPGMRQSDWISHARKRLGEVPYYVFEKE